MGHKAQVAMEFLMTYGWAILVVLVAIGALAYFGVLSPDMFLPSRCSLPSGITCLDFTVKTSSVTLVLQNSLGEDINLSKVEISQKDIISCSNLESRLVKNNGKVTLTLSDCNNGDEKQKFDGEISITYAKTGVSLIHVTKGRITARIEAGGSGDGDGGDGEGICQNADDNGLCDGLDIVFGAGYAAACCSEYSLCC